MSKIREAAVAGGFYPKEKDELKEFVNELLKDAEASLNKEAKIPKAIIAPHAGYIYSGIVAAKAFVVLKNVKDKIKNVILLGVAHRASIYGLAVSGADNFKTALGLVPVNKKLVEELQIFPQISINDKAHEFEHSLEVMLPFLQTLLTDFSIVPILTCSNDVKSAVEVLEKVWNGPETLIVVSSDLSHYHEYADAVKIDTATVQNIMAMQADVTHEQACGAIGIAAIVTAAKHKGLKPHLITLQNSGDTAGPKEQVVGYAAIHFY